MDQDLYSVAHRKQAVLDLVKKFLDDHDDGLHFLHMPHVHKDSGVSLTIRLERATSEEEAEKQIYLCKRIMGEITDGDSLPIRTDPSGYGDVQERED